MAKYIDLDLALSFPFANGEYDHEHANEHFIHGCETYKEWLEQIPAADVAPITKSRVVINNGRLVCFNCCGEVSRDFKYCPWCGARYEVDDDGT